MCIWTKQQVARSCLFLFSISIQIHAEQALELTSLISKARSAVVIIETDRGFGSGFIVRPNGLIVTNYHVISNSSSIAIILHSGEQYHKAYILAEDAARDLAILRVEGTEMPTLPLAATTDYEVGSEVLSIGTPKGLAHTVSTGIISAFRLLPNGTKVIQTTAPSSPGSSGGPLLSRDGKVVGVMTFQISDGQNLNFAVPSGYIAAMVETVEKLSGATPLRILTRYSAIESANIDRFAKKSGDIRTAGIVFVAIRTTSHRSSSRNEVFQEVVNDVLLTVKRAKLPILKDLILNETEEEHMPFVHRILAAAEKLGASHAIILIVDRPVTKWIKLRIQCFSSNGDVVLDETLQEGGGLTSAKAVKKCRDNLVAATRTIISRITKSEVSEPREER